MELTLSLTLIAKVVVFLVASVILAFMCLFPINDNPTSGVQVIVWLALEVLLFSLLFGFLTINMSLG